MGWRLFYCDQYPIPLPPGHKFPIRKYRLLREALERDEVFEFEKAPLVLPEHLRLIHDPDYVDGFLDGTLPPGVVRRIGFPWSEQLVLRSLASVGGTVEAARHALSHKWCGGLAGGTHHAFRDEGSGFCVFNDIAVAIAVLRSEGSIRRAAVVDLDVHQGDGTAKLFEADPEVLTLSLHGGNNFPFRKQTSKIDIAFPDGTSDDEYLDQLRAVLPQVWSFAPDLLFYQSGVDALETDKLGRLKLTREGLRRRDEIVLRGCRSAGVPCTVTLGGGYSDPIEATVEAHANTFRVAAETFTRIAETS